MDVYKAVGGARAAEGAGRQQSDWRGCAGGGLKPHPYLHLAELLPRLLLALRGGRVLGSQVLQLRLQLLAGGHGQGALLAFLVALHLRIPQLRGGREEQAQGTGGPGSLYVLVT